MDQAVSKHSDPEVKHHKNKSMLHKRLPSKEEDGKLLSQFSNSLDAVKLRSSIPEDKLHTLHTPVEFSWKQFWVTMLYENLPPSVDFSDCGSAGRVFILQSLACNEPPLPVYVFI
jgi:hypothetical protein